VCGNWRPKRDSATAHCWPTPGAKVADEIEVESFVERRIDRVRRTRHQKGVTVLRLLGLLVVCAAVAWTMVLLI
jgi:hypothetical protein